MSKKKLKLPKLSHVPEITDRIAETCGLPDDVMEFIKMGEHLCQGDVLITGNRPNRYIAAHPCAAWQKIAENLKEIVE